MQKNSKFLEILSGIYIAAAICLLLAVCRYCDPTVGRKVRQVIAGWEDGPVQQAFGTLTEGLEAGRPIKETFAASLEVLNGEAD